MITLSFVYPLTMFQIIFFWKEKLKSSIMNFLISILRLIQKL